MTTNPSPTKPTKVYQIAVELAQYEPPQHIQMQKLQLNRSQTSPYLLPKILDVDEDQEHTPRRRRQSPFKNIFINLQKDDRMKQDEMINDKTYNIVGRNEVKSYLTKLVKKRNPYFRRNQSALSISRYSSSVKSQHETSAYLNKQDVLNFIKPVLNNQQSPNIASPRNQQILTMQTNNKSSVSIDMFSLKKNRQAFESYNRTWDKERMKKLKFPSILDHIASHRAKVEVREGNSLMEQKLHTKDRVWVDTLRTEKSTDNYYDDRYVERIINNATEFGVKGRNKYQKEMQWIDEKDKAGYSFAFIQGWMSKRGGNGRDNVRRGSYLKDQTRMGQMMGMSRRQVVEKMGASGYSKEGKMMMRRNQSMGDMQGGFRTSAGQATPLGMTSQSGQLSQFSNTQNLSMTQSIRNRPSVIMTPTPNHNQDKNQQPLMKSARRLIM